MTDMNWGRLTPWREMVAGFFDAPNMRPYLDRIGRINLEYALPEDGRDTGQPLAGAAAGGLARQPPWLGSARRISTS